MDFEIVPLRESLVPKVNRLLAGYINSSSNGKDEAPSSPEQERECGEILNRLLRDRLADCYLARRGDAYVGFIVLSWSFSMSKGYPVLRVEALYTLPPYRNAGVGRAMLQHAIDLAKAKNAARLQLETDDDNAPARHLYTGLGFEKIPGKGVYMLFLDHGKR